MAHLTFIVLFYICLHFSDFVYLRSREYEFEKLKLSNISLIGSISKRHETYETIVLKLMVYVDHSEFKKWLNYENNNAYKAEDTLNYYYAHIIDEVRKIYKSVTTSKYRYDVKIVKFVIAKTKDESITENQGVKIGDGVIDYVEALNAMKKWAIDRQRDLPSYGIFVLFTRYFDLHSGSATAGKAYIRTTCFIESSLVILKAKEPRSMMVANIAHEIAHSLGALHDGDQNKCLANDNFLLSPAHSPYVVYEQFSTCTISYFENYIDSLSSPIKAGCLGVEPSYPVDDTFSNYLSVQPGEKYTPDQQCQQAFGLQSKHCPSISNKEDLCWSMTCINPADRICSMLTKADEKTPCGDKKHCSKSKCL